ncbi:MAG: glutamine amidotransferase [Boseongicola sp. SB0677_bin_26]|nr:glutamine amidotransferase [Boseongicola sp. SB0665_bin_10]MYG25528.1 glutamine amidotransferase [Boseongicola sp. SB0677_bin_26]
MTSKPALILQLRPEDEASDGEFRAFIGKGRLNEAEVCRHRMEAGPLPQGFSLDDYSAVIVGGGPGCVSDDPVARDPVEARAEAELLALMPEILARDMPFLGCCYGIGLLAHHLGARVSKERYSEVVSAVPCELTEAGRKDPLLAGLPPRFNALVGHKEAVQELPDGAVHLMFSEACPFQMIRAGENVYATQFHPEADGKVFADRIRIYREFGYFPPEEAAALAAACMAADVTEPERILERFVARYVTTGRSRGTHGDGIGSALPARDVQASGAGGIAGVT